MERRGHVSIPNSFIDNNRISIEARSLAMIIASFNEDRWVRRSELCANTGLGFRKLARLLDELDREYPGLLTRARMDVEPCYAVHFYAVQAV